MHLYLSPNRGDGEDKRQLYRTEITVGSIKRLNQSGRGAGGIFWQIKESTQRTEPNGNGRMQPRNKIAHGNMPKSD